MKKGLVENILEQLEETDFRRIINTSPDVVSGAMRRHEKEKEVVRNFLGALQLAVECMLRHGQKVTLNGIVVLEPKKTEARVGYSFQEKCIVKYPESVKLKVTPCKNLKEAAKEVNIC